MMLAMECETLKLKRVSNKREFIEKQILISGSVKILIDISRSCRGHWSNVVGVIT